MNNRSFSEEEMRQREGRTLPPAQAGAGLPRGPAGGPIPRIYQEQDAMPEDYRAAFREDPRDR